MNIKAAISTLLISFFLSCTSWLQAQTLTLPLWSGPIPGAVKDAEKKWPKPSDESRCIEKISSPEIAVFLPEPAKATGTAVLIFPGGGYGKVCIHHEGYEVAKWLTENGIAGIVLKYRLPSNEIMLDKSIGPLQDAQEAMRVLRRNATKWNIDPRRIGVLGFSAGGHLASTLSTHYQQKVYESRDTTGARPDFSILIYPVISFDETITHMGSRQNLLGQKPDAVALRLYSNELQVDEQTPPAFLAHAADDQGVPVQNSIRYFEALKQHQVSAEMHIYQSGGHGFGMGTKGKTEAAWPEACLRWMKANGWQ